MFPLEFFLYVIFVSTSGVFAPGPLFFANLFYGSKYGSLIGIKIAVGHTIVEFPLIILLSYGISQFSFFSVSNYDILKIVGIIGGIFMIFFSFIQIYSILKTKYFENSTSRNRDYKYNFKSPVLIGILFTGLNPFFLVWWSTIGLKLISDSIDNFGYLNGIIFLFLSHIWMDYFWLWITSWLSFKGRTVIKQKFYRFILLFFSVAIGFYGLYLLITTLL